MAEIQNAESAVRRGFRDAREIIKSLRFWLWEVAIAAPAGGALALTAPAEAAALISYALGVGGAVSTVLLSAFAVWVWQTIRAPFRQRDEARLENNTLKAELDVRNVKHRVLALLIDHLTDGMELRGRRIKYNESLEKLKEHYAQWKLTAAEHIERISPAKAAAFIVIESLHDAQCMGAYNEEHNQIMLMLTEHIGRLRRFLDEYSDD